MMAGRRADSGRQTFSLRVQCRSAPWDLFHPDRNLEITVFPHGYAGLFQHKIGGFARRYGLVGPVNLVDEIREEEILSVDPWNAQCTEAPKGYYPGFTGVTKFAASRWEITVVEGSLLDRVFGESRTIRAYLELSYVNWYFDDAGDFATSVVAKIVPLREREVTSADIAAVAEKANSFIKDVQNWIEGSPLRDTQIALRRYRDAEHQRSTETPPEPEPPPPEPPQQPGGEPSTEAAPPKIVKVPFQFPIKRQLEEPPPEPPPQEIPGGSGAEAVAPKIVKVTVQFPINRK
jgi:hypothetical protein